MKALRFFGLLATLLLTMSFTACSDDDDALTGISQKELLGAWEVAPLDKNATMTDASIWIFNADNTCTCLVGERGITVSYIKKILVQVPKILVGERGITVSYTYQLQNHGKTVQLTTSDGSVINFITGKLSRDQILWQEMPGSGGTRLMHKLVKLVVD